MTYPELVAAVKKLASSRKQLSRDQYEQQAERLIKAAEPYGMAGLIRSLLFAPTGMEKQASPITFYGRDYYPIRNQTEAEAAYSYIQTYRDRLPLTFCTKLARKIIAKHSQGVCYFEDEKLNQLFKIAGFGIAPKETVLAGLNSRHQLYLSHGKKQYAALIKEAIDNIERSGVEDFYTSGTMDKLALLIDKADRDTGICNYYGRGVTPPEEFLFNTTIKEIEDFKRGIVENVKTGKAYHVSDLNRVDVVFLRNLLGDQPFMVDSRSIDPEHFRQWLKEAGTHEAELVDQVFEWSGIKPVGVRVR